MNGVIRKVGLGRAATFAHAASRYWLVVFPAAARELRHRRKLAMEIPDPVLRRLALRALECKRCNLEGASAFELLGYRKRSHTLMRTLTACQAMCDYLDLLAEQPSPDPVRNGACLHQALIVALTPGEAHRDYYAHHSRQSDGGYLNTLVEEVQAGLADLPALAAVQASLGRCAEQIAAYQSFNHGDLSGSYALFEDWAKAQASDAYGMSWWEVGGGAGSTLTAFALIASAADERLDAPAVQAVEKAYFPWIGALHSLLDSLVDQPEDLLTGERGLIGCYPSPELAGERLEAIAREALQQAERLPDGRHRLLVTAMTGFYLCEARKLQSANARAAVPRLLSTAGYLGRIAMQMMAVRHVLCRPPQAELGLSLDEELALIVPTLPKARCSDRQTSARTADEEAGLDDDLNEGPGSKEGLGLEDDDSSIDRRLQPCVSADGACGE